MFETTSTLFEAPNWVGDQLLVNGDGSLWSLPAAGGEAPRKVEILDIPNLNNDHVPAPDGTRIFLSAYDGHIYEAPIGGGGSRRITHGTDVFHFLHGVHPDGDRLAYTRVVVEGDAWGPATEVTIHEIRVDGSGDRQVTKPPGPADGSEYSVDAEWIYFNTEQFSSRPGHAQIARVRAVPGAEPEQLTVDERVNWFPHESSTGGDFVYLSFPEGTLGHPGDLDVELRMVSDGDWTTPRTVVRLFGGQGTINVNSWAPDGSAFAFVDYPISTEGERA